MTSSALPSRGRVPVAVSILVYAFAAGPLCWITLSGFAASCCIFSPPRLSARLLFFSKVLFSQNGEVGATVLSRIVLMTYVPDRDASVRRAGLTWRAHHKYCSFWMLENSWCFRASRMQSKQHHLEWVLLLAFEVPFSSKMPGFEDWVELHANEKPSSMGWAVQFNGF